MSALGFTNRLTKPQFHSRLLKTFSKTRFFLKLVFMATIIDVSTLAGVSITTVSRVLNNVPGVRPELIERVQEAVRTLNYRPNHLARNLRRSESFTVGVLIPDSGNPFFAEVTQGIEETCFEKGYSVVLCNTSESAEKVNTYFTTLYQNQVAGLIVVSSGDIHKRLREVLADGHPVVIVDRPLRDIDADMVVSDNYSGGSQGAQHLLSLGHTRIGVLLGGLDRETVRLRLSGVEDTLKQHGLTLDSNLLFTSGDNEPGTGYLGAQQLFETDEPPSAIFAFNDLMALGALNYIQTHGLRVPEQVSVLGFDNIAIASYTMPSLTTIAQPKYELGRIAAQMLLEHLEGTDPHTPRQIVLPTQLVVRGSTGPAESRP